jgi:hypothetical protein
LAYCVHCGIALRTARSNCPNCAPSSGKKQSAAAEPKEVLFSDFKQNAKAKQKEIDRKAAEKEKKKRQAERIAIKIQAKKEVDEFVSKHKILIGSLEVAVISLLVYGGVQVTINALNGPDKILSEYVSAIQEGNWAAIQDERLFPGSTGEVPEYIKEAFNKSAVSEASIGSVKTEGKSATAQVFLNDLQKVVLDVSLESIPTRFLIFEIPDWKVASRGPQARLSFSDEVTDLQQVSFGSADPIDISVLRGSQESNVLGYSTVLPGVYNIELGAFGFYQANETSTVLWTLGAKEEFVISTPDDQKVAPSVVQNALDRANSLAENCAVNICRQLPDYDVFDFNLWSQYTESQYTYSSFSISDVNSNGCRLDDTVISSYDSASLFFSCKMDVYAHLYVQDVYYYGWYSDYYYYWDFYDYTTTTVYPYVDLSVDESGEIVSIVSSGF